jgi:hypothetical protein
MPTMETAGFRIRTALVPADAFAMKLDPYVKDHLDELNELLGKKVFSPQDDREQVSSLPQFLRRELTPKRVPPKNGAWDPESVAGVLSGLDAEDELSIEDCIDSTPKLVELNYKFQSYLAQHWTSLDYNTRAVMEKYPNITKYLVAYVFHVIDLTDVNAVANFLVKNQNGAKDVINYAVVSAARTLIDAEQMNVRDYNEDVSELVKDLESGGISLSATSFQKTVKARIKRFVFDSDELALIDEADVGEIPQGIRPLLVRYMQASKKAGFPITPANINFHLPVMISQALKAQGSAAAEETPVEVEEQDFEIQFHDDTQEMADISRAAVRCAAQLYHGMVVGDELDVFGVVNYFTHKELIGGALEIRDRRLQANLRMYVFDNKFIDSKTNTVMDRTRPAERQMFYRQVFNEGAAEVTDDVILNAEFKRLWKVMILESARYLQRAQASFNPDNFVSRQNVMQAVEDLQYNLSSSSTGMVNVIAPLIDAELNFVLTKILKDPEVVAHVAPSGGSWLRVVEKLTAKMKRARPRASTLYNKALLGESIIRSIAEYTPGAFEDDETFSKFISQVDRFITTQSIVQESVTEEIVDRDTKQELEAEPEDEYAREAPPGPPPAKRKEAMAAAGGGAGASDEWDF